MAGAEGGSRVHVGVIGGGLAGIGVALELEARGAKVDLFERRARCLDGASRQNEGKIHLGFVYANEGSLATARLMARGAHTFGPLVCRWLGRDRLAVDASAPFHYLVHRRSLLDADSLAAAYRRIVDAARAEAGPDRWYVGRAHAVHARRLTASDAARIADGEDVAAVFETSELAIDPSALAQALRTRLSDSRVVQQLSSRVVAITPEVDRVWLDIDAEGRRERRRYDHVVNAAWDDLWRLDATAQPGEVSSRCFRLKRYLRLPAPAGSAVPSVTIALGPFGDVVAYDSGVVFLSWYPAGCTGLHNGLRHPDPDGDLEGPGRIALRRAIHDGLAPLLPALRSWDDGVLADAAIEGGVILATGTTDVDDPASGLHSRAAVGPHSWGRYHRLDPGKWTTAPLFAHALACTIAGTS